MRTNLAAAVALFSSLALAAIGCDGDPTFSSSAGDPAFEPTALYAGPCTAELDRGEHGPDNAIDETTTFTYEGDLVASESYDGNNDKIFDILKHFSYDVDGNLATDARDGVEWTETNPQYGADGNVDVTYTHTYEDGNLVIFEQDGYGPTSVSDGNTDRRIDYTYDGDDFLVGSSEDLGADEVPDIVIVYANDEYGNPLTIETDGSQWEEADGTVDEVDSYSYEYDGAGNMTKLELDEGNDEILDLRIVYTYDTSGNVLTMSEIWFLEGDQLTVTNTYDSGDRLLTHRYCKDNVCATDTYEHDQYGNTLTTAYSHDNYTADPLVLTTFKFGCWAN